MTQRSGNPRSPTGEGHHLFPPPSQSPRLTIDLERMFAAAAEIPTKRVLEGSQHLAPPFLAATETQLTRRVINSAGHRVPQCLVLRGGMPGGRMRTARGRGSADSREPSLASKPHQPPTGLRLHPTGGREFGSKRPGGMTLEVRRLEESSAQPTRPVMHWQGGHEGRPVSS